jgi:PEP-CTERM motif
VDLDGSTNNAGVLSRNFALVGGTPYLLQFDLAGNQRGGTDTVTIGFGTASLVIGVGATNPYSTRSLSFAPATDGVYTVSFSNAGGDNVGALLDNVVITSVDGGGGGGGGSVPEPGSATLALLGLIGLAAAFKRRPG